MLYFNCVLTFGCVSLSVFCSLFLMVPWVGLLSAIMVLPSNTNSVFMNIVTHKGFLLLLDNKVRSYSSLPVPKLRHPCLSLDILLCVAAVSELTSMCRECLFAQTFTKNSEYDQEKS